MPHRARLALSAPVFRAVTGWIPRYRRRPGARPTGTNPGQGDASDVILTTDEDSQHEDLPVKSDNA